jgi:hypothetical protein
MSAYTCDARSECVCGGGASYVSYAVPSKGVLECVELGNNQARIEQVYGDGLGYSVGDVIFARGQSGMGGRVLVPISEHSDGGTPYATLKMSEDGGYLCRSQGVTDAPPLSSEQFANAVTGDSCAQTLETVDLAWGKSCGTPEADVARFGCGAAGGEASVLLLLALVAALVRAPG